MGYGVCTRAHTPGARFRPITGIVTMKIVIRKDGKLLEATEVARTKGIPDEYVASAKLASDMTQLARASAAARSMSSLRNRPKSSASSETACTFAPSTRRGSP